MASQRAHSDADIAILDESCPLLRDPIRLEAQQSKTEPTPIPKVPLLALCAVRLVEPMAFSQIFPWINEFIRDIHVTDDPSRIGFYSGIVESAFAIAQLISIYQWARVSDLVGRRPILLAGAIGVALATVASGISKSIISAVVARFFAGLFSGTVAVVHSVLCEITDATNQAAVFPIYGLFWPLGVVIGPLLGGMLSNPASKYPNLFDNAFFRDYPYFLPCFVVAMLSILGFFLGFFILEETLPRKRHVRCLKSSSVSAETLSIKSEPSLSDKPPTCGQLLRTPMVRALCTTGSALSFNNTSYDVVFVLFCYSPVQSGGLGFSASEIGYSLAGAGVIAALLQLTVMPRLLRTFDNLRIYQFSMAMWPYSFAILPLLNMIAYYGTVETTGAMRPDAAAALWVGIGITLLVSRIGMLAFSVSMILIKEHTSPTGIGATNGLVQLCMCLMRAIAPMFVSSSFALSIDNNLLGGYLWALVMVLICWRGYVLTKRMGRAKTGYTVTAQGHAVSLY